MHICQPLFWPLKIFQDRFFFIISFFVYFTFFFSFLQFSINYRWYNLLKCSNCFEANFISIHLFHDIPQTFRHRVVFIDTIFCFVGVFFTWICNSLELTSVFFDIDAHFCCCCCCYRCCCSKDVLLHYIPIHNIILYYL